MTTNPQHQEPSEKELKMARAFSEGDKEIESLLLSFWSTDKGRYGAGNGDDAASDAALIRFIRAETASKTEAAIKELDLGIGQLNGKHHEGNCTPIDHLTAAKDIIESLSKPSTANLDSREDS